MQVFVLQAVKGEGHFSTQTLLKTLAFLVAHDTVDSPPVLLPVLQKLV